MDLSTALILGVAGILGMNQMIFRLPGWETRRAVFWSLQGLNLVIITALLAIGIPGFQGATKVVNWVLGLLLVHHVISNNGRLAAALRDGRTESDTALDQRREQIKSALRSSQEE